MGHGFVGDEKHNNVGQGHSLGDGLHDKAVGSGTIGVFVVAVADDDRQAAVTQVQGLGAALVAIADDGDLSICEQAQVCVWIVVKVHFATWC
jgi:hypothetical protein